MLEEVVMHRPRWIYRFARIAALIGWFAVLGRLYISISNGLEDGEVVRNVITYVSYFTIWANTLAALALTASSFFPTQAIAQSRWVTFFTRPGVNTAIAAYITIAAIVYAVLLSDLSDTQGFDHFIDVLLHNVMPTLFAIYWWLGISKQDLGWRGIFSWIGVPLVYLVYTLILGVVRDRYPYPFIDVNELGYLRALLNAAGIILSLGVLALLFVAIGKLQTRISEKR